MIWSLDVESAAPRRAKTVHFQSKLAIRPTMFFLLNNEPCLMPVLLLGSFWLFEIPSCWVRSLISHAFVARFGEWKKSKSFDFFVPRLASFAKPSFYPPPHPFLSSKSFAFIFVLCFFAPFLLRLRDNNVSPPPHFLFYQVLSSLACSKMWLSSCRGALGPPPPPPPAAAACLPPGFWSNQTLALAHSG